MSGEERQAQQLAQWLAAPTEGPPADLDADVLEGLYALRPDLAPPPRLLPSDILDDLLEGPLALPAPDLLAATAMADWLDAGGTAPDVLDEDVVEGLTALRPELAAPPTLTAQDILDDVPAATTVATDASISTAAPANNHRWFLLSAAGGSGLLAVAAAALFTLTVSMNTGQEGAVAAADPSTEEPEPSTTARQRQSAPQADDFAAASPLEPAGAEGVEGGEAKSKKDPAEKAPESTMPTGGAAAAPQASPPREESAKDGLLAARDLQMETRSTSNTPSDLGGLTGAGGLSLGAGNAGETDAASSGRGYNTAEQPTRSPSPRPAKPKPQTITTTTRPSKREALDERWAPPPAPSTEVASAPPVAPAREPAEFEEEATVADLDDAFEDRDRSDFAFDDEVAGVTAGSAREPDSTEQLSDVTIDTRGRRPVRRSKVATKSASNMAEVDEMDEASEDSTAEQAPVIEVPEPDPAPDKEGESSGLRQSAAGGVGSVRRRAGAESEITPPQAQGEPVAIHLAEAALARRDYAGAQSIARSGLSLGGANTPERAWLFVLDGDAAAAQGESGAAERSWREAIRLNNTRTASPSTETEQLMSDPD